MSNLAASTITSEILQKRQNDLATRIAQNLTPRELVVIQASVYPSIKELKAEQLKSPIIDAIVGAFFIKGISKTSAGDVKDIAEYVIKTLKDSFTTYKVTEICQAIELGARGELFSENDMNVISPENIFKWIHRYNEKIRKEAIHKQKHHEEKLAKETTEKERQEKIKQFEVQILRLYEEFPIGFKKRNKGVVASYYRHLDSIGLIKMSVEQKKDIYKQVLKIRDRTKWMKKTFIELTAKELSEYRALYYTFTEWKLFEYDLKEKFSETKTQNI